MKLINKVYGQVHIVSYYIFDYIDSLNNKYSKLLLEKFLEPKHLFKTNIQCLYRFCICHLLVLTSYIVTLRFSASKSICSESRWSYLESSIIAENKDKHTILWQHFCAIHENNLKKKMVLVRKFYV